MPLSGGGGHALCRWRCADLRGAMFIRASSSSEAVPSLLSRDESESSSSLPAAFSPSSARDSKPSVPTPKAQPSHLNWSWSCRLPERKNVDTTTGTVSSVKEGTSTAQMASAIVHGVSARKRGAPESDPGLMPSSLETSEASSWVSCAAACGWPCFQWTYVFPRSRYCRGTHLSAYLFCSSITVCLISRLS